MTVPFSFDGPIDVQSDPGPVTVILHDGQKVTIEPGKTKVLFIRGDNKFHLLDCQCDWCTKASGQ